MRGTKALGLMLCAALCCGIVGCSSGQSEAPVVEKKQITLNVKCPPLALAFDAGHSDSEAIDLLKEAGEAFCASYEDAEVTINYTRFPYPEEGEAVLGSFGTDKAVDVVLAGQFNVPTYVHSGRAVAIDDIIDDGLRSDIDQVIWDQCSDGGKTYVLPLYQLQNTLMVNPELLRDAELERFIPADGTVAQWSTDEFKEIVAGLKESMDDGETFPLALWASNNQGDTHIMSLLRSHGLNLFDDQGRFQVNTPEGIAALTWLNELNEEGMVPKGCENLEYASAVDLFDNGQIAICPGNKTTMLAERAADFEPFAANFPTPDGKGCATTFLTGFTVFDNDDADRVQVAKDFVRFIYSDDAYLQYALSGTPVSASFIERNESTGESAELDKEFSANSENVYDFLNNTPNWDGVRSQFYLSIQDMLRGSITPEEAAANIDETCNAAIDEGYAAAGGA
ncbi:ABC transporter substrate-binding protein [Raoultibacter massiliensis]|uniref:Extracellular solute-binding protein n=1 Tax=Raoultibacter massiliensis TaxID=1852371 RepID=A0ABV1JEL1_9ACTN